MSLLGISIGQKSFWLTLPTFLQKYCSLYYPGIIRIFKVTMDENDLFITPRSLFDEIKLSLFIVILFFLKSTKFDLQILQLSKLENTVFQQNR